ncbi:MAG: hypothetical protein PHF14_14210 [Verrucomicrobiota bacterium]|jgi:hypothetical protein|nr:hypothetical protein [Verrucomicrobiota bacterium]MDD8047613.1 hypothetical protein [Verrucomicrobiota bacterium]MDD8051678.1 hypothetical protein [Verrucomicrobiota bacterium]
MGERDLLVKKVFEREGDDPVLIAVWLSDPNLATLYETAAVFRREAVAVCRF